ncbi:MAG: hypothetical protein ABFD91_03820 [Anaerohalosphaeraceae bacterium]
MKIRLGHIVLPFIIAVGVVPGFAAPLNPAQINRQANWVLHADMDTFKSTTLSAFLRQKSAEAGLEEQMESFKKMFSFHPIDDVHGVTIYGFDTEEDHAVALIHAEFNANKLISLLSQPEMVAYGPHTIYSWNVKTGKKNKREYGTIWGYNLILMSGSIESVQHAIDVLDGTTENAATGSYLSGYVAEPGQFLYVRADQIYEIAKNDPDDIMMKQMEQLLMIAGEVNGRFQCRVDVGIPSQEKLVEIEQICRGLLAYGLLDFKQNNPELSPLLQAVQIQSSAGLLSAWMEYKSSDFVDALSKAAKRAAAKENAVSAGSTAKAK